MRFFHISDLHIGKQLYSYSLLPDQRAVLKEITERAKEYRPDAILIAGDVFDRSIPSGEAYTVLDEFLTGLSEITPQIPVLLIAGNHDSAERLDYASGFLEKHQIHIAVSAPERADEYLKKITLTDDFGPVHFYLLPFLKPAYVRRLFPGEEINDYETALRRILERENLDFSERNVLLSHQFYKNGSIGPETSDSEQASSNIGGLDSVDVSLVEPFNYVALGHIHSSQKVGREEVRYAGSPLKYSLSEVNHIKSVPLVTLGEKGKVSVELIPLSPMRDLRHIKGSIRELLDKKHVQSPEDFIYATLTDEESISDDM